MLECSEGIDGQMEDLEDILNPHFQGLEEYLERPGAKRAQDVIGLVPTEESDLEN
jgi:hypothetical protein